MSDVKYLRVIKPPYINKKHRLLLACDGSAAIQHMRAQPPTSNSAASTPTDCRSRDEPTDLEDQWIQFGNVRQYSTRSNWGRGTFYTHVSDTFIFII